MAAMMAELLTPPTEGRGCRVFCLCWSRWTRWIWGFFQGFRLMRCYLSWIWMDMDLGGH